jgi:drug/metabolite transporter (DMT)-like permease
LVGTTSFWYNISLDGCIFCDRLLDISVTDTGLQQVPISEDFVSISDRYGSYLQLGVVSILCAVVNIVHMYFFSGPADAKHKNERTTTTSTTIHTSVTTTPTPTDRIIEARYWILGLHFLWKMKCCFSVGYLFGLKYSCSKIGSKLVSATTHLLLQSTDLVWTVLGAHIINKERSSTIEIGCLAGCVVGSVVLSWQLLFDKNISIIMNHR